MKKIFLTEKQLNKNFVLREYKGEQLVLPFDGNTRAYNYMQYIDYLQHNAVGKTLQTNFRTPNDYLKTLSNKDFLNLFDCSFYWGSDGEDFNYDGFLNFAYSLNEKYPNLFDEDIFDYDETETSEELIKLSNNKRLARKIFLEEGKKKIWNLISNFDINEKGLIYCERGLEIPPIFSRTVDNDSSLDFYTWLNDEFEGNAGAYWSYAKNGGIPYETDYSRRGEMVIIVLQGYTRFEDIDLYQTMMQDNYGELELRLTTDGGLVEINNIIVKLNGKNINLQANYPFVVRA